MSRNYSFDAEKFERLLSQSDSSLQKARGKPLTLIIGLSKNGKSAFINFLQGNRLVRDTSEPGEPGVKVQREEGEADFERDVELGLSPAIGNSGSSETKFPTAYPVEIDDELFYCCDTAGFADSRGVEHEMCARLTVDLAIKHAESVRVVVIVQGSAFLEKRQNNHFTLRTLASVLYDLLPDSHLIDSLRFVVSKPEFADYETLQFLTMDHQFMMEKLEAISPLNNTMLSRPLNPTDEAKMYYIVELMQQIPKKHFLFSNFIHGEADLDAARQFVASDDFNPIPTDDFSIPLSEDVIGRAYHFVAPIAQNYLELQRRVAFRNERRAQKTLANQGLQLEIDTLSERKMGYEHEINEDQEAILKGNEDLEIINRKIRVFQNKILEQSDLISENECYISDCNVLIARYEEEKVYYANEDTKQKHRDENVAIRDGYIQTQKTHIVTYQANIDRANSEIRKINAHLQVKNRQHSLLVETLQQEAREARRQQLSDEIETIDSSILEKNATIEANNADMERDVSDIAALQEAIESHNASFQTAHRLIERLGDFEDEVILEFFASYPTEAVDAGSGHDSMDSASDSRSSASIAGSLPVTLLGGSEDGTESIGSFHTASLGTDRVFEP